MDDDDEFLYGPSKTEPEPNTVTPSEPQPIALEKTPASSNGIIAHLEAEAAASLKEQSEDSEPADDAQGEEEEEEEEEEEAEEEEDSEDDDLEIIMDMPSRSLDLRANNVRSKPDTAALKTPRAPQQSQPSLTTEYTLRDRTSIAETPQAAPSTSQVQAQTPNTQPSAPGETRAPGPDPSTLPPVTAPASHPTVDPSIPGVVDGRSILEVDLSSLADKPWRRPGADISDWFNYGFDEISWEAYCYRRRDVGDLAHVLKANVVNFAGMPEDQLASLPPEIRTMVMTGANALMANGGPAPAAAMIGAVPMNPHHAMMDMSTMGGMNMGQMDMGMNPAAAGMGIPMQPGGGPPMMPDGSGVGVGVGSSTPDPTVAQMGLGDGFGGTPNHQGMMGLGIAGEFGMQEPNAMNQSPMNQNALGAQGMYPGMEQPTTPVPGSGRGLGFNRGRGERGLRGFAGRGRGRPSTDRPPIPVRPASPLPPNVPTGPRNHNKYKDRDNNGPAVDGLDYGGGGGGGKESGRTSADTEERTRKRRNSPSLDDTRGSKRR